MPKVIYKHNDKVDEYNNPIAPDASVIQYGELFINNISGNEKLFIKNSNNAVVGIRINTETYDNMVSLTNSHVNNTNNPHGVTKIQIGLENVDNTSDANKAVNSILQAELDKKMNVSDIYNSLEESTTIDLTKAPWSAAQGYSMNNVIDTWQAQDTSELEARIKWCEDNV